MSMSVSLLVVQSIGIGAVVPLVLCNTTPTFLGISCCSQNAAEGKGFSLALSKDCSDDQHDKSCESIPGGL